MWSAPASIQEASYSSIELSTDSASGESADTSSDSSRVSGEGGVHGRHHCRSADLFVVNPNLHISVHGMCLMLAITIVTLSISMLR